MAKTSRIQVELSDQRLIELESLMHVCGFETKKDFFNHAISLLRWVVKQTQSGGAILSQNSGTGATVELSTPFLDHILDHAPAMGAADSETMLPPRQRRVSDLLPMDSTRPQSSDPR